MNSKKVVYSLITLLMFTFAIYPQTNEGVDPNFVPRITGDAALSTSSDIIQIKIQPDGKLLAYGGVLNKMIRYNTDGTLDTSFDCTGCDSIEVRSVFVQTDGKILAAGPSTTQPVTKAIRLNMNGSLDQTFSAVFQAPNPSLGNHLLIYDIQADGKIYVGFVRGDGIFNVQNTQVYRLNPDGSIDNTFTPINNSETLGPLDTVKLKVLSDGRVFIFGRTAYGVLAQINSDGSQDSSFSSPAITNSNTQFRPEISSIVLQSGGKIVVAGTFTNINGIARHDIARLNADSSVDISFDPQFPAFNSGYGFVKAAAGGKLFFGEKGLFKIYRLNSDGSIDNTYNSPGITFGSNFGSFDRSLFEVDSQDRIYIIYTQNNAYKISRLNPDGSLDTSYNPVFDKIGSVSRLAVQPDGKIIVVGTFKRINNVPQNGKIVRLNADGTLDTGFNAASFSIGEITDVAVQADGKILFAGAGFVRLNADGSYDTTFNPAVNGYSVNTIAIQSNGKILVGGSFFSTGGVPRTSIARINPDGTLDTSFNPMLGNASVAKIVVQPDGKIVIGGNFSGINGFNRSNFARLNSDGSLDTGFNPASHNITLLVRQPDGKYVLKTGSNVLRVNADGSADNSFPTINEFGINQIYVQPNGSIVLAGSFTFLKGVSKQRIARVFSDGSLDNSFLPNGANDTVKALAAQPDGKLLVGGDFSKIGNVTRFALARLTLDSVVVQPSPTRFDYDGDGKADVSVFRPSNGAWYLNQSTNGFAGVLFGISTDLITPADFDGDGKTDLAVFRPSNGTWYYLRSSDNGFAAVQFGTSGDVPIPGDFDGDGKADINVFRPSNGVWYRLNSSNGTFSFAAFGQNGDVPLQGDFNGDGKADLAVFRPSAGYWYIARPTGTPSQNFDAVQFGIGTDIPVPADYDGDGITDVSVFRPSNGTWYRLNSTDGSFAFAAFGQNGDIPVAADYDGDGKANLTVFRPSTGSWYIARPTGTPAQNFDAVPFGVSTDKPTPAAFQQ